MFYALLKAMRTHIVLGRWIGKGPVLWIPPEFLNNMYDVVLVLWDLANEKTDMRFMDVVELLVREWRGLLRNNTYTRGVVEGRDAFERRVKLLSVVLQKRNRVFYEYMLVNFYCIAESLKVYFMDDVEYFRRCRFCQVIGAIGKFVTELAVKEIEGLCTVYENNCNVTNM